MPAALDLCTSGLQPCVDGDVRDPVYSHQINHSNISGLSSGSLTVWSKPSAKVPFSAPSKKGDAAVSKSRCMVYVVCGWLLEAADPTITVATECRLLKLVRRLYRGGGCGAVGVHRSIGSRQDTDDISDGEGEGDCA